MADVRQKHCVGMMEAARFSAEPPPSLRSYDVKAVSECHRKDTGPDELVQQHFKEDVDINVIMKRFGLTGSMPFGTDTGVYGDFTGIQDFESAVDRVEGARERFMKLPAEVRERFGNDPGRLIAQAQSMTEQEFQNLVYPPKAEDKPADKPAE